MPIPNSQVEGYRQLLPKLLSSDLFIGHGIPNIRGFIEAENAFLKNLVLTHPSYNDDIRKLNLLWINLFINPDMLFCHKHTTEAKFSDYFAPIILSDNSDTQTAIKELHNVFYNHYSSPEKQRIFYTFSDLEPDFKQSNIKTPPAPGHMVGITFNGDIVLHPDDPYSPASNVIKNDESKHQKIIEYAKQVTKEGEWVYYIYSAGYHDPAKSDNDIWFGKAYLAYKKEEECHQCCLNESQLKSLKNICFDLLSMFALAGALVRNRPVVNMISDFKKMMDNIHARSYRHRDIFRQFGGYSRTGSNREELNETLRLTERENFKEIDNELESLQLTGVLNHKKDCATCSKSNYDFKHAMCFCPNLQMAFKKDLVDKITKTSASIIPSMDGINLEPWAVALCKVHYEIIQQTSIESTKVEFLSSLNDRYVWALSLLLTDNIVSTNLGKFNLTQKKDMNPRITAEEVSEKVMLLKISYDIECNDKETAVNIDFPNKEISIRGKLKPESLSYVLLFADCFFSDVLFKVITKYNGSITQASFKTGLLQDDINMEVDDNTCSYIFMLRV